MLFVHRMLSESKILMKEYCFFQEDQADSYIDVIPLPFHPLWERFSGGFVDAINLWLRCGNAANRHSGLSGADSPRPNSPSPGLVMGFPESTSAYSRAGEQTDLGGSG